MFNEIPKNCRYGYARVSSKSQEDNSSLVSFELTFAGIITVPQNDPIGGPKCNLLFLPKLDPNVTFLSWKIIFQFLKIFEERFGI